MKTKHQQTSNNQPLANGTYVEFKRDIEGSGTIIARKLITPKFFGTSYYVYAVKTNHREARYDIELKTEVIWLDEDQLHID